VRRQRCEQQDEELWSKVGGAGSVHVAPWPEPADDASTDEVDLVVQVDGRVRDRITVPAGLDQDAAVATAEASPKVTRALEGLTVVRSVHVPDRLVNLVTAGRGHEAASADRRKVRR